MSGHGQIEAEHRETMNKLAQVLKDIFPNDGFCLLVFAFDDEPGKRMNYISNANREDMITAMKELIANMEGRVIDAPKTKQ